MWFVLSIFVWVFITGGRSLVCEHYHNTSLPNEHPCESHEIQADGICNKTSTCETNPFHRVTHCFSLWKNESGKIAVTMKGCWEGAEECINRSQCVTDVWKEVMFCCCEGDLCNADFHYNPPTTTDKGPQVDEIPESQSETYLVFVYALLPISCLSMLIIAGFVCYEKRKRNALDNMDNRSVETPGSGASATTATSNLLTPGQIELDFPQLIELKARGRFGCVWKAQLQNRFVAVKIFYLQDKQSWQNEQDIFKTELVNNHPNILHFVAAASRGVGVETELWLITEFHELGSLADYLKMNTLPITDTLRFMESMASGLSFLHEDILCNGKLGSTCYKPAIAHRDFKSKNVLITSKKTAVIADFGLAVKFVPGECTGENHGQVGTRRYMAPEILEGAINFQRDAFLRIDIYAFALVLWEIISRCHDAPDGAEPVFCMPYEEELGQHPSLEEMQEHVVDKKLRPRMKREWKQHQIIGVLCETIEECWDQDAEARLSAGCVHQRLCNLSKKIISPPGDIPIHSNLISSNTVHYFPSNHTILDTEQQNQINAQRSEVARMHCNEEERLITTETYSPVDDLQVSARSGSSLLTYDQDYKA